jgi:hypothetical protein
MKKLIIPIFLILVIMPGCNLIPKNVEYFQDKVEEVPEMGVKEDESLKQAAALAADKARMTVDAAQAAQVPQEVLDPAHDTRDLTEAVSDRIGPPLKPWKGEIEALTRKMEAQEARHERELAEYRDQIRELAGKKIEGSGAIQLGYFTNLLMLAALAVIAWIILKVVAVSNPPLQVGMKAVTLGTKAAQRSLVEIIQGGQEFKVKVADAFRQDPETLKRIHDLFTQAHLETQSRDTHETVKALK